MAAAPEHYQASIIYDADQRFPIDKEEEKKLASLRQRLLACYRTVAYYGIDQPVRLVDCPPADCCVVLLFLNDSKWNVQHDSINLVPVAVVRRVRTLCFWVMPAIAMSTITCRVVVLAEISYFKRGAMVSCHDSIVIFVLSHSFRDTGILCIAHSLGRS